MTPDPSDTLQVPSRRCAPWILLASSMTLVLAACDFSPQASSDAGTNQTMAKRLTDALAEIATLKADLDNARADTKHFDADRDSARAQAATARAEAARLEKALLDKDEALNAADLQARAVDEHISALNDAVAASKVQNSQMVLLVGQLRMELEDAGRNAAAMSSELKSSRASAQAGGASEQLLAEIAALKHQNTMLNQQLVAATEKAAQSSGGPNLVDQAKEHSKQAFKTYRALLQHARSRRSQSKKLEAAQLALQQTQTELARLSKARGVYRVQAGDTLIAIAGHQYRDARRWPEILEANRHLVDKPDQVVPGLVLVIP